MMRADIVILSWDRIDDTLAAVKSALNQKGVDVQVAIVDQGSEPDGLMHLKQACAPLENVTLLTNPRNVGVPGGRNQGAAAGTSDIIVFLDNDAVFENPDCIRKAAEQLNAEPSVAALSFAVECFDRPGGRISPDMSSWVYGRRSAQAWWRRRFKERLFVGAGVAVRRSAFEEAGGFDANLFFLHEEEDLSHWMIQNGYSIVYSGDIAVRHKVSPEHRFRWSGSRTFYNARNRLYLDIKHNRPVSDMLSNAVVALVRAARIGGVGGAFSALRGLGSGVMAAPRARAARQATPVPIRTEAGERYIGALQREEERLGIGHPIDQYSGVSKLLRRLRWETRPQTAARELQTE